MTDMVEGSCVGAGAPHDHAWRRGQRDAKINMIEYTCDLCTTTYSGPGFSPESRA